MTSEQKFITGPCGRRRGGIRRRADPAQRRAIDFGGRVVVITGGSRGLGLVMARKLAAQGARLVLMARDERELERAKRLLEEEYGGAVPRGPLRRSPPGRRQSGRGPVLDRWATSTC